MRSRNAGKTVTDVAWANARNWRTPPCVPVDFRQSSARPGDAGTNKQITKTGHSMKKILLALVLVSQSAIAKAEWVAVGRIDALGGGAVLYVDFFRTRINGHTFKMWSLMDFKNEQEIEGIKFMSSKFQKEFDCNKKRWRILSSSMFSKNMGNEEPVQSDNDPDEWKPAEAESLGKAEWGIACRKRPAD